MESYYAVANIYKEYLKNDKQAIEYFKKLLSEYPQNTYRLQAAYNLYRLLASPTNEPYKRIVLDEFPKACLPRSFWIRTTSSNWSAKTMPSRNTMPPPLPFLSRSNTHKSGRA
jgi:hypothetical protein